MTLNLDDTHVTATPVRPFAPNTYTHHAHWRRAWTIFWYTWCTTNTVVSRLFVLYVVLQQLPNPAIECRYWYEMHTSFFTLILASSDMCLLLLVPFWGATWISHYVEYIRLCWWAPPSPSLPPFNRQNIIKMSIEHHQWYFRYTGSKSNVWKYHNLQDVGCRLCIECSEGLCAVVHTYYTSKSTKI